MRPKQGPAESYESLHEKAKGLLGENYDEKRVDVVLAMGVAEEAMQELAEMASVSDPAERARLAEAWYDKNDWTKEGLSDAA